MKKKVFFIVFSILCLGFNSKAIEINKNVPTHYIPSPNLEQIKIEDDLNNTKGQRYRVGIASYVNLTTSNSGVWKTLLNGDKMWQLIIKNTGAKSLSFVFKTFILSKGSSFWVQTIAGKKVSKNYSKVDMLEDFQQNVAICYGDELVLTLVDKQYENPSNLTLQRVIYNYQSIGKSDNSKINESNSCEINVNCNEGSDYQDEKKGIALAYIVEENEAFICSGSLINNLALDNKPLFLTALHCGINTSSTDMMLWRFYFNYEAEGCANPLETGTLLNNYLTSCFRLADSGDGGGVTGSDFLLVQIGSLSNQDSIIALLKSENITAYWNGWDASTTISSKGVSIHHPAGDIKKISSYFSPLSSSAYGSNAHGTHWKVQWAATTNGIGISEHGSSGCPLFTFNDGNSRIIGTLTGGSSLCVDPTRPDIFGKMSYHWLSNGKTLATQLKTFLDPYNTGVYILNGSSDPKDFASKKNKDENIKIYPNPTSEILILDFSSLSFQLVDVKIVDMKGNIISSKIYPTGILINVDLNGIDKGIYQIHIQSDKIKLIQRFIKI